jgi:phosphomannomutase
MWLTGHSFIKSKVRETRAQFGGALSGHFFFMDNFFGHDDGAFATLRLLQFLKREGKKLAQVVDELPLYISSPEIKLGLADDIKFDFIKTHFAADLKALFPNADSSDIDGFRVDTETSMAIIRASQNGPYVTIKFEGKTQEEYDRLKHSLRDILKKYPEVDWTSGVNTHAFE